ncbi:MAG: hypothetical protein JWQ43_3798 [Glaciihabitans sp.]|nr:hypothetical protein [Glaciihabitans sp.]
MVRLAQDEPHSVGELFCKGRSHPPSVSGDVDVDEPGDTPGWYPEVAGMSVAIDSIECMFDHGGMAHASAAVTVETRPAPETVKQLQDRIRSMQATKLDSRLVPTHPAIAGLLPGGGLKQGATYSVDRSATLLMALLAGPSAAGSWCAVVGVPEFGVEAAASFGIDLDRLVLVPHPGDQWLAVTSAVADVMGIVVTRPPKRASDSQVTRLSARLRQRGSTLVVLGPWPQSEAMLSLSESSWSGIGDGTGHLSARQVTVTVTSRVGVRPQSARLWLPDPEQKFRDVEAPVAEVGRDAWGSPADSPRTRLKAVG